MFVDTAARHFTDLLARFQLNIEALLLTIMYLYYMFVILSDGIDYQILDFTQNANAPKLSCLIDFNMTLKHDSQVFSG